MADNERLKMSISFRDAFPILTVLDVERSLAFYRGLLGFELAYSWPVQGTPVFATVKLGGAVLGLGVARDGSGLPWTPRLEPDGPSRPVELCLTTDDVDAAVAALAVAGMPVLYPPTDQPWGERMAYVADPDGYRVMLTSPPMAAASTDPPPRGDATAAGSN